MNFTLIHYLSNGDDYCMNCHMGSSSSDFGVFFFVKIEDIIAKYAALLMEEAVEKDVYGTHEYIVLIDGADQSNSWDDEKDDFLHEELFNRIEKESREQSLPLIQAHKEAEQKKFAAHKKEKEEQELRWKKQEFERLKRELGA